MYVGLTKIVFLWIHPSNSNLEKTAPGVDRAWSRLVILNFRD